MCKNTKNIKSAAADIMAKGHEEINVEGFYVNTESLTENVLDSYDLYEIGYALEMPHASLDKIIKAFEKWLSNFEKNLF